MGKADILKHGKDLTLVSLGVGAHHALQAGALLEKQGVSCEVIDLRWVAPLDREVLRASVARTGRIVVVDEDYECCGLSGEIAALLLESGLQPGYARVCTKSTIPYARNLEDQTLPSVFRIVDAAQHLLG